MKYAPLIILTILLAAAVLLSCSRDAEETVSVVSVSPPDGSTIQPHESIVVEFSDVPENLVVYLQHQGRDRDISTDALKMQYRVSLSGQIATIPFASLEYPFNGKIEVRGLKLSWGSPGQKITHLLSFFIEPDWADGVLTITVGNYQTGAEMLGALKRRYVSISRSLGTYLTRPDFPMSRAKKSVDVAVVPLLEDVVGFEEQVTMEEIRKRYRELGYRPLTLEEAVELRLQFSDQPSDDRFKYSDDGLFMSGFTALLSEESSRFLRACVDRSIVGLVGYAPCDEDKDKDIEEFLNGTLQIANFNDFSLDWQRGGRSIRILWFSEETLFNPYNPYYFTRNDFERVESVFACVLEK